MKLEIEKVWERKSEEREKYFLGILEEMDGWWWSALMMPCVNVIYFLDFLDIGPSIFQTLKLVHKIMRVYLQFGLSWKYSFNSNL